MSNTPEDYMRIALALARKGWGETSPNPMVGAVIVKNGRIIAQGWHHRDGAPHAEIECLRAAEESVEGAEMYVTLEPCSTHGRTGACCDAIANAKIAKVYVGATDPNPAHAGRAKQVLQERGIDCQMGVLADECESLNFIFNTAIVSQSAVIAVKYAISADDKISETPTKPTQITGEEARKDVMMWRRLFKSIAVGRNTLEADNPRLTARIGDTETSPIRLVFDSSLSLATHDIKNYTLFSDKFANRTRIVCDIDASTEKLNLLRKSGVEVMQIQEKSRTPEFWYALKKQLYNERINSLLIEGGAEIIRNVIATKSAEFAFEYCNPSLILGETAYPLWEKERPFDFASSKMLKFGNDTLTYGKISYR